MALLQALSSQWLSFFVSTLEAPSPSSATSHPSRNTGSCPTSSPLTKSATRENAMEGPKGPGPHPVAALGPLSVLVRLGRLRVGSAVQPRQAPPYNRSKARHHRRTGAHRVADVALRRQLPTPPTLPPHTPCARVPSRRHVQSSAEPGLQLPSPTPNRRGARAPSSHARMWLQELSRQP